jgi:ATP-binding cassette subfamily B protein
MAMEKRLRDYIKPRAKMMAAGLTIKAGGSFLELLLPYILSMIIDDIVPSGNRKAILIWGGVMVICALLAWIMNVAANRNAGMVARDMTKSLRHDLFEHTLYLSCEKTDAFTIPSLESRLTSDTYNVHRMMGMMQRMGVRAPIITIGGLILCFILEPVLGLVFLAVIPFMLVVIYLRTSKGVPLYRGVQKANDHMASVTRENAQGIRVIKALSRTEYEKAHFAKANDELKDKEIHANLLMAAINPMMNLFLYAGMIGVIILGAYRVNAGLSEAGKILAFMSYFQMISHSLMAISRLFIMYSRGMASCERIMEVLNTENEKNWQPANEPDGDPQYALQFKDVSFSYLKVKDNIQHLSFALKKGETLGIIGATGSGKSTILSLLLHFYAIDSGAIYLNGKNIKNIEPDALRRQFGIVMQNDFLFSDTVKENIRFGREVSDEDLQDAINNAQAEEFISALSEKEDSALTSKGTNVSGGQRQRILLSRAFAAQPDFLLLDDSSSALDYKTDSLLRKALNEKYPDTTMVIVAQRVSSIKGCDQIIVLDHGVVNGHGTDQQLMKNNALYAAIADSQMGGALFD